MGTRTVHVTIKGRVQGVGYRDWTVRAAKAHGLNGWVRNLRNGDVEAVFSGSENAVAAMLAECRRGPSSATVTEIIESAAPHSDTPGFHRLSTL